MDSLLRLVQGLTAAEIHFFNVYYGTRSLDKSKRFLLFKLILAGKVKSNVDAIKKVYPGRSNPQSALSHLKKKLSEDVLNIMLIVSLDDHLSMEKSQELKCKKSLMQCELLLARGLHSEGFSLLKKTASLADKYEFPDINIASFKILSRYHHKIDRDNYFHRYEESLEGYQSLLKVKEAYLYGRENGGQSVTKRVANDAGSKQTQYWHKLLDIENLCRGCEYVEAKDRAICLLNYLEREVPVNTAEKEAKLYKILAEVLLHLGEYAPATSYAERACAILLPHTLDYQNALVLLFFTYLRSERLDDAEKVYIQATRHSDLDDELTNKWILFKAALEFAERNYKNVNTMLAGLNSKFRENTYWILSPRLLELLTILEIEDYDRYEFRIDCLRKKIASLKSKMTERVRIVYYLLQSLIRTGFDYDLLVEREQDSFIKLKNPSPDYSWNPLGHELINIPRWILSKSSQFKINGYSTI